MNEHVLGEKIEKTRRALGLTQVELADIAGISYRPIMEIERGKSIRLDTLLRICDALGLEITLRDKGGMVNERS